MEIDELGEDKAWEFLFFSSFFLESFSPSENWETAEKQGNNDPNFYHLTTTVGKSLFFAF